MGMAVVGNVCQITAALTKLFHLREVAAPANVLTHVQSVLAAVISAQFVIAKTDVKSQPIER